MRAAMSAVALAAQCAAVSAQTPNVREGQPLPADADLMIVVRDAAKHRQSAAGRALVAALDESGSFARTGQAWAALAKRLEWSDEQAFDEILGRRVAFVKRTSEAGDRQWAILTQVTPETERRLRQRLVAVPRASVAGVSLLGLEDGAYELAVSHSKPARGASEQQLVTVLLGPREGGLVDELAPKLREQSSVFAGISADVVATLRHRQPDGEQSRIVLTARATGRGWDANIIASPHPIGGLASKRETWSDAAFQKLERGALVAVMGSVDSHLSLAAAASVAGVADLAGLLPLSLQEDDRVERCAIVIQACEPPPARGPVMAMDPGRVTLTKPASDGSAPHARLAVTYGVLTRDTRELARTGDQTVASAIAGVRSGREATGAKIEMTVPEFEARGLRLADIVEDNADVLETLTSYFGPDPTLRWGVCTAFGLSGAQSRPGAGWWSATLAPAGTKAADQAAVALASDHGGLARARISLGVIRPAQLLRCTSGADGADVLSPLNCLRRVAEVRWDAWVRPDGMLQCDVSIRIGE